jgi:hypothetical protein
MEAQIASNDAQQRWVTVSEERSARIYQQHSDISA